MLFDPPAGYSLPPHQKPLGLSPKSALVALVTDRFEKEIWLEPFGTEMLEV
jgi:hypothetical protein